MGFSNGRRDKQVLWHVYSEFEKVTIVSNRDLEDWIETVGGIGYVINRNQPRTMAGSRDCARAANLVPQFCPLFVKSSSTAGKINVCESHLALSRRTLICSMCSTFDFSKSKSLTWLMRWKFPISTKGYSASCCRDILNALQCQPSERNQ